MPPHKQASESAMEETRKAEVAYCKQLLGLSPSKPGPPPQQQGQQMQQMQQLSAASPAERVYASLVLQVWGVAGTVWFGGWSSPFGMWRSVSC